MQPDKAVNNEKQDLAGWENTLRGLFLWLGVWLSWQKVDIESKKVDIQDKKVDIESVFSEKGKEFSFFYFFVTFLW